MGAEHDHELWRYKHELSRKIQDPVIELNLMLSEAAKRGVIVNVIVESTKQNAPFVDALVFTQDG